MGDHGFDVVIGAAFIIASPHVTARESYIRHLLVRKSYFLVGLLACPFPGSHAGYGDPSDLFSRGPCVDACVRRLLPPSGSSKPLRDLLMCQRKEKQGRALGTTRQKNLVT